MGETSFRPSILESSAICSAVEKYEEVEFLKKISQLWKQLQSARTIFSKVFNEESSVKASVSPPRTFT